MKKDTLILIDLSWLMYKSIFVYDESKFFSYKGTERIPTGHVFGTLRTIASLRKMFWDSDIVLCRDGVPKERIELMGGTVEEDEDGKLHVKKGEYKEGRANASYNIHRDTRNICLMCSAWPRTYYAYDKYKESDDLMYALAKSNKDNYRRILLYTGDNDLLQTVDENIFIIRSLAKDAPVIDDAYIVNCTDFKIHANQLPIYRSLRGDSSDTIEGVYPRLSKDFARYVAENFNSVSEIQWYECPKDNPWKKWFDRIQNPRSLALLERNYKLMKLNVFSVELYHTEYSKEVESFYFDYKMTSYLSYLKKALNIV